MSARNKWLELLSLRLSKWELRLNIQNMICSSLEITQWFKFAGVFLLVVGMAILLFSIACGNLLLLPFITCIPSGNSNLYTDLGLVLGIIGIVLFFAVFEYEWSLGERASR